VAIDAGALAKTLAGMRQSASVQVLTDRGQAL